MPINQSKTVFFESCEAQVAANNKATQGNRKPLSAWACDFIYDLLIDLGYDDNNIMQGIPKILFFFKEDYVGSLIKKFVLEEGEVLPSYEDENGWCYDSLFDCEQLNVITMQTKDIGEDGERAIYNLNYFTLED